MNENVWPLILLGGGLLAFLLVVPFLSKNYSLNNFKSKTVGDGQHGTARWATPREIHTTYHVVPFRPRRWRKGEDLPTVQGIILGSMGGRKRRAKKGAISQATHKLLERLRRPTAGKKEKRKPKKKKTAISKIKNVVEDQQDVRALVDSDDIHCLMIGASGVGKTAYFLYANLEYASASGMSYLALDTKGDLARNYGAIASRYYGYKVSVIDLRNPTRSDGFNFLTLMNHYMDIARMHPENLAARARAEKYAKILAKTIINPDGDATQYGENAFFYDSAEGLLTAIVLLLAEFAPPKDGEPEKRHIVSREKKAKRSPSSYQPSSWCRICWRYRSQEARMAFSCSWMNCHRSIRPGGWQAQPSPVRISLWLRSCPPSCPASTPFWIRNWSRSSATTAPSTPKCLPRRSAPSF